ncbi:hypothetical protein [Amycolatopsis albispora]|uniref:PPE family domain-containing protein n=1 Tax=Amycolatopsis albispora TaxID=1804986 RepID=A0A344LF75_9PSEU|nr:hypothetical protein [Amycolatopsis albispora]AXB46699.1 hypothetical protein A4R43_33190 [Amycolatopsis albispora]
MTEEHQPMTQKDLLAGAQEDIEKNKTRLWDGAPDFEGAGLIQDIADGYTKCTNGEWTEGLLDVAVGAVVDGAGYLKNPVESLLSMGFGWVIEHLSPLKDLLDWFVGNQDQLSLAVNAWSKVSDGVQAAAEHFTAKVMEDSATWWGVAAEQYRKYAQQRVDILRALSDSARTVATAVEISKSILKVVRDIIRGILADTAAKVMMILCRTPPPGYAVAVATEVAPTVAQQSTKAMSWTQRLVKAFQNLQKLLSDLMGRLGGLGRLMTNLGKEGGAYGSVLKNATTQAFNEQLLNLPKRVGTEIGKEATKSAGGNYVKSQTSEGRTEADKQARWSESDAKQQSDQQKTHIYDTRPEYDVPEEPAAAQPVMPFQTKGDNTISGSID